MAFVDHLEDAFVVAGTGSRSFENLTPEARGAVLDRLKRVLALNREKHGKLVVLSGAARGWDRYLALTAKELDIPYALCVPTRSYGDYYYRGYERNWATLTDGALAIEYTMEDVHGFHGALYLHGEHANFVRNRRMVELADAFVVYNPTSTGTRHCVTQIELAKLPWRDLTHGNELYLPE